MLKKSRTDLAPSTLKVENNVKDRPKADYESALSSPVVFILMVVGNTPQTLSTLSDSTLETSRKLEIGLTNDFL